MLIPVQRDGDVAAAKAAAESPRAIRRRFYVGWIAALYERDYDTALSYLGDWEMDVDAANSFYVPKASYYGVTYRLAQRPELAERAFQTARVHLEEALEANPDDARLVVSLGQAMAELGEHEEGVQLARRAMELMPTIRDAGVGPVVQLDAIIRVFAPAGDYNAMIAELDAYLAGPGWWSIDGLLPDPRWDPIRDDPRFQALVEKYRRQ